MSSNHPECRCLYRLFNLGGAKEYRRGEEQIKKLQTMPLDSKAGTTYWIVSGRLCDLSRSERRGLMNTS